MLISNNILKEIFQFEQNERNLSMNYAALQNSFEQPRNKTGPTTPNHPKHTCSFCNFQLINTSVNLRLKPSIDIFFYLLLFM